MAGDLDIKGVAERDVQAGQHERLYVLAGSSRMGNIFVTSRTAAVAFTREPAHWLPQDPGVHR